MTSKNNPNRGKSAPVGPEVLPRYLAMGHWTPRNQRGYRGANNGKRK